MRYIWLFLSSCRNCIIDKNARIGKNVIIANKEVSISAKLSAPSLPHPHHHFLKFLWREGGKEG
jgi:hypothetical protein